MKNYFYFSVIAYFFFINAISEGFNHSAPFSPLFGIFQNMSMQTFIALASSECGGGLKLL